MMREAVTTPVPPMPGMRSTVVPDQGRAGGSGSEVRWGRDTSAVGAVMTTAVVAGDDEGGALALDAGLVEVATALVHRHLGAEVRVDVDERHAGGVVGTVAAAFADPAVDPHRLGQRRTLARGCAAAVPPPHRDRNG